MADKLYSYFEISIVDLRKLISPLTKKYKDIRTDLLGSEKQLMRIQNVTYSPKFTKVRFTVPSTEKKSKKYSVNVQVADVRPERFMEDMRNNNCKVSCSCKSFVWQGMAYTLTKLEASLIEVDIPDEVWGKRHGNESPRVCKHLKGVLGSMNTFYPIIYGELEKKMKNKNKKSMPKVKDIVAPKKDVRSVNVNKSSALKTTIGKPPKKQKLSGKFE